MIISNKVVHCTILLTVSAAILAGSSQALACQYAAATSDLALMNTFPIPTFLSAKDFVARQASDFAILPDSWTGHGIEAFDDTKFEYTKHWMSSYLIANGAEFEHRAQGDDSTGQHLDILLDRAFHTAADYYTMAKASPTSGERLATCGPRGACFGPPWHRQFVSLLGTFDPVKLGEYFWSEHPPISAILFWPLALFPEETETVTTFCGLFDVQQQTTTQVGSGPPITVYLPDTQNIFGSPSERASDLVHEGMHAHYRDVSAVDHVNCTTGASASTGGCDRFYPHPKSDYAGGDLNHADANTHRIPAYEIQLEYLCDLLDEAKDWVPLALLSDAEATAGRTALFKFVGPTGTPTPPPFNCSVPSPMMQVPGTMCSVAPCATQSDCSAGICSAGCCQVVK